MRTKTIQSEKAQEHDISFEKEEKERSSEFIFSETMIWDYQLSKKSSAGIIIYGNYTRGKNKSDFEGHTLIRRFRMKRITIH
jgi:hypothetical protein